MTSRTLLIGVLIFAAVEILVITAIIYHCDGEETLESLSWQSRQDTVWQAHKTSTTDTLERLDSIIRVRQERNK